MSVTSQGEAAPIINELMTANGTAILDEDFDYRDWIEIFNPAAAAVDLTGYGLSDNPDDPFKWIIPSLVLDPGDYTVIFASGKDRSNPPNHFETVITQGDDWQYFVGVSEPPAEWLGPDFDDAEWETGPSGFGFADSDDATVFLKDANSIYLRKSFSVDEVANITHGILQIDYDDAFVAYLNGVQIARSDLFGNFYFPPAYDTAPNFQHEALMFRGLDPEVNKIRDIQSLLVPGENILAVQVNNSKNSSDFTAIPFLTLGMTEPPATPRGVPEVLEYSTKYYLHTNFKLSAEGEQLILTDPSGNAVDDITIGVLTPDFSLGRHPDGGMELVAFAEPTPGESNGEPGFQEFAAPIQASLPGGFYYDGIEVELSTGSANAKIYYTLDGNDPTEESTLYEGQIGITETTVLKARAYETGYMPGEILIQTYFMDEDITLPVVSLSTPPDNLFDSKIGIYVEGTNKYYENTRYNANYGEDWERPIHLEFYEPDGSLGFQQHAGMKIIGLGSRSSARKSFAVFARGKYGQSEINYKIFPDMDIDSFKALAFRNGGNDWKSTLIRDGMMQSIVEDIDLDIMAYRPAVLFINGEYWGIHNIREKQNEDYLASHHNIDPDNVDMMEIYWRVQGPRLIEGDLDSYLAMMDFLNNNDMSLPENYDHIKTLMQVENFMDNQIINIFVGNHDWPGNNNKAWRPKTPDGKWRWLVFDLDWGFGYDSGKGGYKQNMMEHATQSEHDGWPNPKFSTNILRTLVDNEEFRNDFVNRFSDYMNTIFSADVVKEKIRVMKEAIEPDIPAHTARWRTPVSWSSKVFVLNTFADNRVSFMRTHLEEYFGLSGTAEVNFDVSDPVAGKIVINTLVPDEYPWAGTYFKGVPVKVTAIPNPGFRFARWEGADTGEEAALLLDLDGDSLLTAVFEEGIVVENAIVINEINYNSSADFNPEDWVELYNPHNNEVDVSGWIFKDENDLHEFIIPDNTVIPANGFLVLCTDMELFHDKFPSVENYIGDLVFGLGSGGELIRLFNTEDVIVDSLTYDNNLPWPEAPDGDGPSLALIEPSLYNSLPESWAPSVMYGTPGAENEVQNVGVNENESNLPVSFSLGQNYPNPFNPVTTIPFSVPKDGKVTIEVYSILGQRVSTVFDGNMSPGRHNVVFKGNGLAAGIYFYIIRADGFTETKSMIFLK
ncbi:hypothetical protein ES708_04151 [subsurface metagenome]